MTCVWGMCSHLQCEKCDGCMPPLSEAEKEGLQSVKMLEDQQPRFHGDHADEGLQQWVFLRVLLEHQEESLIDCVVSPSSFFLHNGGHLPDPVKSLVLVTPLTLSCMA